MNIVALTGRLTAKPDLKTINGETSVTTFCLAVRRSYAPKNGERQTDFIDCVAWRSTAESLCKYLDKGSAVNIVGEIQTRTYTDKNGQNRKTVEVVVSSWEFGESKKTNEPAVSEAIVEDDADLPF